MKHMGKRMIRWIAPSMQIIGLSSVLACACASVVTYRNHEHIPVVVMSDIPASPVADRQGFPILLHTVQPHDCMIEGMAYWDREGELHATLNQINCAGQTGMQPIHGVLIGRVKTSVPEAGDKMTVILTKRLMIER